jgi:hypothetical protein
MPKFARFNNVKCSLCDHSLGVHDAETNTCVVCKRSGDGPCIFGSKAAWIEFNEGLQVNCPVPNLKK